MNNPTLARAVKLALLSAGAVAIASPPTVAQEEDVIEEIVTTGSRIKRADLESVSPLQVIGAEEFRLSGILNVEQKLAELPLTLPAFGPSSNNPGDGTAQVDLRGLGISRTLVLVNGRRWISARQDAVVDLNTIPGTLIKQVDVVTGGASAVYGSDAMAGVVNFQFIDNFEGVEITTLYDVSTEGDAEKFNIDLTMGGNFDNGRGNATVYLSFSDRKALFQGERDFSFFALGDNNPVGTPGQNPNTGVGGPLSASGSSGTLGTTLFLGAYDPTGTLPGGPFFDAGFTPACGSAAGTPTFCGTFNADGTTSPWDNIASRFNYAPDNFLQLPQERFMLQAFAHYDITDNVTAYTEIAAVSNKVPQELAPTPAFLYTVEVNPDSPFFAPAVQAALDAARYDTNGDGIIDGNDNASLFLIGRRMRENGSRQAIDTRDAIRLLFGAEGDFNDNWGFDVYGMFARLENSNLLNNDVSDTRFRQAVLVDDTGTACQDPSGGCAPMNIFGAGNINQAAIDFVNIGASNVTSLDQYVGNVAITGELGSIGDAAPMAVAFGVEYRDDQSTFRPDAFLSAGDVLGFNAGLQTIGSYNVTEFFAEIAIPLLEDVPFAQNLDLWLAGRSSDYSNIGSVSTYAGAINWAPIEQVRFRFGIQRAVRAPNVNELFQGLANGFPGAVDPCSSSGDNAANPSAGLIATCEATGVPVGLTGILVQQNTQLEGLFGGFGGLTEETGDTITLGVILHPLDNLDITIDYFDIEIENAISILGGSLDGALDICYNVLEDPNSVYCQAVTRTAGGSVRIVELLNANIGGLTTSGIDFSVNYSQDFDFGFFGEGSDLSVQLRSTFLDDATILPDPNSPRQVQCAGGFSGEGLCGTARSDVQFNTRITWINGPLGLSVLWRYLSAVDDELVINEGIDPSTLSVPTVDSINYVDLTATYNVSDLFSVNVGVKNIFDELPTHLGDTQEQANTFPEVYDVIGPRVFVSASYKWE